MPEKDATFELVKENVETFYHLLTSGRCLVHLVEVCHLAWFDSMKIYIQSKKNYIKLCC